DSRRPRACAPGRGGTRGCGRHACTRRGGAAMRAVSPEFTGYGWAPSTADIARLAGIDPIEVIRYDGNVAAQPLPSTRPGTIAGQLARIHTYAHGGRPELRAAVARVDGL